MSPLANQRHDIILNSVGYSLLAESYRKKAQQPFNPRFSTGDPSLTDLSFWQFMSQEAWNGGAGQLDFSTVNKHQKSSGWSFINGYPKLSGGNAPVSLAAITELANVEAIGGTTCHVPSIHRFVPFGMTTDGRRNIVLAGIGASGFLADGTRSTLRSPAVGVTGLTQLLCYTAEKWNRINPDDAGTDGFLAVGVYESGANKMFVYDNQWNLIATVACSAVQPRCIIPVNYNYLLAVGPTTSAGLGLLRQQYTADTWTSTAITTGGTSDVPCVPSPHYAIDSNGVIYVALTSPLALSTYEGFHSSIMLMTSADVLVANGPAISSITDYPDYIFTGLALVNGTVHAIGARMLKGATPKFVACVISFPKTTVWESEYSSATLLDVLPRTLYADGRNECVFVNKNKASGCYQSVMRLSANGVEEIFSIAEDATATRHDLCAVGRVGSSLYAYDRSQNAVIMATQDPTTTRTTANTCVLTSSRYGGNTPLIDKTLYSLTTELSEAITAGETLTIKVNGTTIGTMVNADGVSKTITMTSEITENYFEVSYEMTSTSTWNGEIRKHVLRYVPTQFKKLAWAIGIRCDKNIKLIDGTKEAHTGAELYDHLFTAWQSNVPISFTDIDGTAYTVIVTDFDQRRPLINERGAVNEESFIFMELLEV